MSVYEWERGTIALPSGAVAQVKAAVRTAANAEHERVYEAARAWWRTHGRRALSMKRRSPRGWVDTYSVSEAGLDEATDYAVGQAIHHERAPKREDVVPERANTRTSTFAVGHEALIQFEGRQVTWAVGENNHAVERAREDPVARAFFAALGRVTWTRGSGGEIVGNDEYNRDSDHAGGGANYVTARFGPKTKAELAAERRARSTAWAGRGW